MAGANRPEFIPARGHWNTSQGTSARALWLDPSSLRRAIPLGRGMVGPASHVGSDGLLLGELGDGLPVAYRDDRHLVTIAGSRAGKTRTMLVPNLRTYAGSAVVIDPKGELAEMTAPERLALGQRVRILDPFGEIAKRGRLRTRIERLGLTMSDASDRLNPLDELAGVSLDHLPGEAAALGDALILSSDREPHWGDAARKLLQAVALLLRSGESDWPANLNTIVSFFASIDTQHDLFAEMAILPDAFEGFLADVAATNKARIGNSGEYSSIISTGDTQLAPLRDLAAISSTSDFALADLKREPTTLYLVLPASKLGSHYRWLRLIVTLALAALERTDWPDPDHPPPPVLFVLEEFAALGNMRPIERAAGYMAGFGVKLWPILQDLPQLRTHYPNSWQTFLGNAGMIQVFGLNDGNTEEFVSQRLGVTQFEEPDIRTQPDFASRRVDVPLVKRSGRLLEPHEVRLLFSRDTGRQIVMIPDLPPIALYRLRHGEN